MTVEIVGVDWRVTSNPGMNVVIFNDIKSQSRDKQIQDSNPTTVAHRHRDGRQLSEVRA